MAEAVQAQTRSIEGTISSEEKVCIVDAQNNVVGAASRGEMRTQVLPHRATFIFVRRSTGELVVQKRSMLKDFCPGFFDVATGGVVGEGESYEENARRELEEELGVPAEVPLGHCFTFYVEQLEGPVAHRCRCWGDAWECEYDGELTLQEEEVESVHLMFPADALRRAEAGAPFTPDGMVALQRYIDFCKRRGDGGSNLTSAQAAPVVE